MITICAWGGCICHICITRYVANYKYTFIKSKVFDDTYDFMPYMTLFKVGTIKNGYTIPKNIQIKEYWV